MNTRLGHVAYMKLRVRRSTLKSFCRDFRIDISTQLKSLPNTELEKDKYLEENFVYFLLENKVFMQMYQLDYYSNKTVEIIANKTGRKKTDIDKYLENKNYKIDIRYPFRYISSYKIDYELGRDYKFLEYKEHHMYEGNFEYRRRDHV